VWYNGLVNGGERVGRTLRELGVPFLFTLCGGHISPILVGCKQSGIRVVDVRHEATAVFAADAVARLTGRPGVAALTAGPGLTNTITALKNAQLAQSPVVVLGGATATTLRGRGALQDIDQRALIGPHVKSVACLRRVRDIEGSIRRAFEIATSGIPGPVFVELPVDLLYPEAVVRDWYRTTAGKSRSFGDRLLAWYLERHLNRTFAGGTPPTFALPPPSVPQPTQRDVRRAARRLARAERPVLLVGSQAMAGAVEAQEVAASVSASGVPVFLSGMARGLLGAGHELQIRHRRKEALREADLVLLAGVPCDFSLNYGRHISRRSYLVGVNRCRHDLRLNRRPDLAIHADPGVFLRDLARHAKDTRERWRPWREKLVQRDLERNRDIRSRSEKRAEGGLNPLRLCLEIEAQAEDDSVIVADGGDFVATASYIVRPRAPLSWLDPGVFGTLGVGAGFALGAKLCRPESEVWLLYGDGSAGYTLAEFDTFVRHRVPVLAVVGNDACWSQIARGQVEILGDDVACSLLPSSYDKVVAGFGAKGILLREERELGEAVRSAKRAVREGTPVLLNALLGTSDFRSGSISI